MFEAFSLAYELLPPELFESPDNLHGRWASVMKWDSWRWSNYASSAMQERMAWWLSSMTEAAF